MPTDAPIRSLTLISQLQLHLPLPVEPTLYLLPPSRTMPDGESTMMLWRKPRKLQMLSLVCFLSTTLLQLCYFILEHHILSYVLHMLRNIICIALLKCQIIVSSPGGDMPARQICPKVNIKIRGVDIVTNLIVLES
jgi:hypothetical protein